MLVGIILLGLTVAGAWFLVHFDHGPKKPLMALAEAFGFGLLATGVVLGVSFIGDLIWGSHWLAATGVVGVIGEAAIEELAKFVPLALFIDRRKYFNEINDGVIYFALVGLGFALVENLLYAFSLGVTGTLGRVILLLFFHAATTGLVGYFLARSKLLREPLTKTLVALVAVILLHGWYNASLNLAVDIPGFFWVALVITIGLNLGLIGIYLRAEQLDRELGLEARHAGKFCEHCGRPNLHRTLFCEYCGYKS